MQMQGRALCVHRPAVPAEPGTFPRLKAVPCADPNTEGPSIKITRCPGLSLSFPTTDTKRPWGRPGAMLTIGMGSISMVPEQTTASCHGGSGVFWGSRVTPPSLVTASC